MGQLDDKASVDWKAAWISWDPYDVCRRLVRNNDLGLEDPADNARHKDASRAREFWTTVAKYPESLQEALYALVEDQGFEMALSALDKAIHEHLHNDAATGRRKVNGRRGKPPAKLNGHSASAEKG